jgi:hypothetical protein
MSATDADRGTTFGGQRRRLALRHFAPLAGFVLPTVVIGYGVVIPRSCIAGLNELTFGFAATVVGACLTYWAGLRLVARDGERRDGEA